MLASIVLTPRTIIDGLTSAILNDLMNAVSMKVVWEKYWQMKETDVYAIYPKLKDRPFCDNLVRNLTLGDSLVLLVSGNNELYDTLTRVKGEFRVVDYKNPRVSGLRLKYWPCREIVSKRINHPDNDLFFEYRIHTTNSLKETIVLMNLCMNDMGVEIGASPQTT